MSHKVEEPPYVVSATLENDVEIREYFPQIWAVALAASESGELHGTWQLTFLEIMTARRE